MDKPGVQLQELKYPGQVCPLCNQQKAYYPVQVANTESEVIVVCGCTPRLTQ